jgi:hypothetical protein
MLSIGRPERPTLQSLAIPKPQPETRHPFISHLADWNGRPWADRLDVDLCVLLPKKPRDAIQSRPSAWLIVISSPQAPLPRSGFVHRAEIDIQTGIAISN